MAERLAGGASIEAIAREVGRDPSTVSYWARKHGLTRRTRRATPRAAAIERELLPRSSAASSRSATWPTSSTAARRTVRHWLRRHASRRPTQDGAAIARPAAPRRQRELELPLPASRHDPPRAPADGFRCARCRVEHVADKRRASSGKLVREAGGRCELCGYDRCAAALQFHHVDRATKRFALSHEGVTRARQAREEAAKCVLLCANCHAEVEGGFAQLPLRSVDPPVFLRSAGLTVRGSSIRQSIRLLIEGLWVRVPPPELDSSKPSRIARGPPAAGFVASGVGACRGLS